MYRQSLSKLNNIEQILENNKLSYQIINLFICQKYIRIYI